MHKPISITYASALTDLCEKNKSFDSGVLKVAYWGENRNKTSISKEAFERSIPTMYNCPIVCNYDRDTDTIGGHDIEIVSTADGGVKMVNITSPVGCIPESAKYWWDTVTEEDGTQHEYLFVEALLWKRQEAYRKIKSDGVTAQSMELVVKDGEKKDGIFNIYDFEFTAFALIGVEPCFESAALEFSKNSFKQELAEMMEDLRESFSLSSASFMESGDDINAQISMKGGSEALEDIITVETKEDIVADGGRVEEEFGAIDDLREKLGMPIVGDDEDLEEESDQDQGDEEPGESGGKSAPEKSGDKSEEDPKDPDEDPEEDPESVDEPGETLTESLNDEFALNSGIREALWDAVRSIETVACEWGPEPRYWMIDFDFDTKEVYCDDGIERILCGFSFDMNGDVAEIDINSKKRKKYAIVDFDEGEAPSPFGVFRKEITEEKEKKFAVSAELSSLKASVSEMETELSELRNYKHDAEAAKADAEKSKVFSMFADLADIDEFIALQEHAGDYDIDSLEEKCFAIRGRHSTVAKFNLADKAPRLRVDRQDEGDADMPYGGVVEKYSKRKR